MNRPKGIFYLRSGKFTFYSGAEGLDMQLLSPERIRSIYAIAVELGLSEARDTLFSAMSTLKARLATTSSPSGQLLNDLNALNGLPLQSDLTDGPLELWLESAIALRGHDPRCSLLKEALVDVRRSRGSGPTVPSADKAPNIPVRMYLSYAHEDESYAKLLRKHINPLVRKGEVVLRDKSKLASAAHEPLAQQLERELSTVHLFLPFVSPDYWGDNECGEEEEQALKLHKSAGLRMVPILTRPYNWQETELKSLQALPNNRDFLSKLPDADSAMVEVVKALHAMVKELKQR